MKTKSSNLFTQLSSNALENLTNTVKETFAKNVVNQQQKTFSSADLWNIQRNRRTIEKKKKKVLENNKI